jgi:hypothetical protein
MFGDAGSQSTFVMEAIGGKVELVFAVQFSEAKHLIKEIAGLKRADDKQSAARRARD